ncbi:LysR family transcriptional regulator [Parahaliea maris]|uniref:LysR family transcriptional regulator n=1 Tax=Parahaliea maris TaxID=2716870 RepID=A0A5C8ZS14_9GAMM|nr:LysR family transcriptional regulator [Parahaliea maris]TXS90297.1 LysR family transcriptional regulator [Parahaliea maris]
MRLNRLDLNLLVALDALLSERSITRAAERIHLSQPATSGALARLREFFEDDLLVRVGAQMAPTPLGESLAAPVHNILLQIQATVERKLDFDESESRRKFRFLVSDYTATTLMADVIRRVTELAPGLRFEFFAPTNNPWEKLEQGDVDFLIMPEHVLSGDHPSRTLFNEEFVCIGWEENPLLNGELTVEKFLSAGHVTVRFGSQRAQSQDQIYLSERQGLELREEIVASTFSAIPQYLSGTMRIATVYKQLAEQWVNYLPLKMVPVPLKMPSIPWGIQWHKFRDLDPGIQWLSEQIVQVARER